MKQAPFPPFRHWEALVLKLRPWEALVLIAVIVLVVTYMTPSTSAQLGLLTSDVTEAVSGQGLVVSSTAVGLTNIPVNTRRLDCTVTGHALRFRYDGADPTASVGHIAAAGETFTLHGVNNVRRFKAVRAFSLDADLFCTASR
jgi:hypothetical protein